MSSANLSGACDIVGAGAAGRVVARRLAESGSRSVLLLEAGPDLRFNPPADLHDGWRLVSRFDWAKELHQRLVRSGVPV
jgi:choline dehydrogenase-like flavoprotein